MRLSQLLHKMGYAAPALDQNIIGLANNSQQVQPGYLFLACRGKTSDGHHYIPEALARGAAAVFVEGDPVISVDHNDFQQVPIIKIADLTEQLYAIAAYFYAYPAESLQLIGVTGTNGKTSCSFFIAQTLHALRQPCGVIGTLGSGLLGGPLHEEGMTTPDALRLQKIFAMFHAQKIKYVAMEISSHSLDQQRIDGLAFEAGIFTNLTQDHLDYHHTMTAYAAAKKRFFTDYRMKTAVINADDPIGREWLGLLPPDKRVAYGIQVPKNLSARQVVSVKDVQFDWSGIYASVFTPWGEGQLFTPLVGEFNLSNILAVVATLGAMGFPLADILAFFPHLQAVPGRMQVFGGQSQPKVIVDYAHTPDALEKVLRTLRRHCQGQLYCLFGCGGDRDKGKRPLMAAIAERYADRVMLTNDNPRHEDPEAILAEILAGFHKPQQVVIEANRSQAIKDIIQWANPGDYVLIAGKGAEAYQQIGDKKLPFNDGEIILEILRT